MSRAGRQFEHSFRFGSDETRSLEPAQREDDDGFD